MDFKEVENLLYEYGEISGKIKKLRDELNRELQSKEDVLNLLKASTISDMPKGSSQLDPIYQVVQRSLDVYMGRIEKLREEIDCLNKKRDFVDELLKRLNKTEREIIELRYFQEYSWVTVALEKGFSRPQCFNIRNAAMKKMVS